ncbi:MAG TPA: DUF2130 domain-containing protein [Patescibacteria group bacterium]|nr:DUF2130 domain-containing protein [Patescibacteria group bacterium]
MQTTITCPYCKKTIELSDALTHQIKDKKLEEMNEKHAEELEEMKMKLEAAQNTELELRKQKNKLDEEKRTFELDKQRQLDSEREKIRQKTLEEAAESQRLKEKEKDKVIEDLKKSLEDAQRKATQGSQQLQGEVQELDLEQTFKREFPGDTIEPIGKGVLGADIRQTVRSPRGMDCGRILWESKRTKAWSDGWVSKLKEDLRNDKSNIPAIISDVLPDEIKTGIGLKDGVWVARTQLAVPLAMLLRKTLLDAARQRMISENKQSKAEELYGYITSHEFAQQVESMIETYNEMQVQITKERTAYERNWKQREAQVTRLLNGVAGIYGSMQGIAGTALPTIHNLELPDENRNE